MVMPAGWLFRQRETVSIQTDLSLDPAPHPPELCNPGQGKGPL